MQTAKLLVPISSNQECFQLKLQTGTCSIALANGIQQTIQRLDVLYTPKFPPDTPWVDMTFAQSKYTVNELLFMQLPEQAYITISTRTDNYRQLQLTSSLFKKKTVN
jgi:hypothetical protein